VDVVEGDGYHLPGAQSVGRNQQEHRIVTQSLCRGSVNRSEKGTDGLPREAARQLLELAKAWLINLTVQPGGNPAVYGHESKESSQRAEVLLEAGPAQAFTGLGGIGFEVTGLNLLQRDPLFLQMLEKALRRIPVVGNSGGSESPYFA